MPFKDLLTRKNMAAILVSYTIYTDSTFAVSSVISQLFIAEVRPSTLEFSLYSLAQSLFLMGCTLAFLWMSVESCRVTLPTFQADLRKWHDLDHGTATSGRRDEEIDKIPGRHDHAMTEKSLQQL